VYDSSLLDSRASVTDPSAGGEDATGAVGGGGRSSQAEGGSGNSAANNGGANDDAGSSPVGGSGSAANGGTGASMTGGGGGPGSGGASNGGAASAGNAGSAGAIGTGSAGGSGVAGAPSGGSAGAGGVPLNPCDRKNWLATASESSVSPSNPPALAIDGVATTRWSTGATQVGGEWFLLDLGARAAHLTQVVLDASLNPGDQPLKYKLEVSDDGKTYALVCTGTGASTTTIKFVDTPARYIRITQTGSAADANWWSIQELTLTCSPN
jgi:hypothetical protein